LIEPASAVEPGARIAFEFTGKQGGALITKYPTYQEDIEREHTFEDYIKKHYDSWVKFSRDQGHGKDIRPVLVTGVDLTREFATVAYSADRTHMECKFSAVAPGLASASAELWGSWEVKGLVRTNCGPRPVRPPQRDHGSSGGSTLESAIPLDKYHQCVFIRYYTIHKFLGMIPEVIKAGAGEHQLPKRDPRGDNTGEEGLRASSDDNSTEVDCTETGSRALSASDEVEVIHNVSSVCPEHYTRSPPTYKLDQG
jgi:hypothetical protein